MPLIGTIGVGLVATTNDFKSGLNRGVSYLRQFAKSHDNIWGRAAGVVAKHAKAILGFAAAIGAVIYEAKKAAMALADMAKLADRLGTTQPRLAGLQVAAQRVGINPEEVGGALQQMTRHLAKARYEGGDAARVIRALGLDLAKLEKMDAAHAFIAIAQQIQKLPTDYQRALAAQEIFGRAGIEFLALLRLGAEDYGAAMEEANRSGMAKSAEAIQEALEAQKKWNDAARECVGIWEALAPLVTGIGAAVTVIVKWVRTLADVLMITATVAIVAVLGAAWAMLRLVEAIVKAAAHLPKWLGGGIAADLGDVVEGARTTIGSLMEELDKGGKKYSDDILKTWGALQGVEKDAATKAAAAATIPGAKPYMSPALFGGHRPADFRQEALSRVAGALPGMGAVGKQQTADTKTHELLHETNAHLRRLAPAGAVR